MKMMLQFKKIQFISSDINGHERLHITVMITRDPGQSISIVMGWFFCHMSLKYFSQIIRWISSQNFVVITIILLSKTCPLFPSHVQYID